MVELNRDLIINKLDYKLDHDTMIISFKNINKIDSNTFKQFTEITYLSLCSNRIEQLEVDLFESLSKLETLRLCDNRLKEIRFKGLVKLKTLHLSGNQLTTINENCFITLSNLNELCLYSNKLNQIESNAFKGLVNLKILKLNYNQIEVIQEGSFNGLSNLRDLHLEHNKLKRIDVNSFGNLNKLETLLLDHNELESIEGLFVGLSNLKDLHLEHNKLNKRIERSCFDSLKSIKLIQLDSTKFKVFSFLQENDKYCYKYTNRLEKIGFLTDWNCFLDQFQTPFKDFHTLRLLIVDYYDSLISEIDIYTDELSDSIKHQEYRAKAIEEINKVKYENLERYEMNREKYKFDRNELTDEKLESIRSELFEEKFCFLLRTDNKNSEFNLITVVSDFYLNQFDLNLIKSLSQCYLNFLYKDLLVFTFLLDYIISETTSNQVISISRETLRKIKDIKMEDLKSGLNSVLKLTDISRIKSICMKLQSDELIKDRNLGKHLKNLEYLSVFEQVEFIGLTFECDICKKTFEATTKLENHRRIHFGERDNKKSFNRSRVSFKKTKTINNYEKS